MTPLDTTIARVIRRDIQDMHAYAVQPSAGFIKLDAMVTDTSDGEIAIFFTHVCGSGGMPLVFPGDSAAEVLANLKAGHKQWTP